MTVKGQQDSNDESPVRRETVTFEQFLSEMNGGARIYDYKVFAGIEPLEQNKDSVAGLVVGINYAVVKENAPEAPQMMGEDLLITSEFWDWQRAFVVQRECHLTISHQDAVMLRTLKGE